MSIGKKSPLKFITLIIILIFISGCLSTAVVDKEKAGYIAGIRFLETHPGEVASYSISDPGGDAFLVYFNMTNQEGVQTDFAEYYVDRFTKDIYVSSNYATRLAIPQSPELERLFKKYPEAKVHGNLIKTDDSASRKYVWEIRVIANGVNVAVIGFDAAEEKLLAKNIKDSLSFDINLGK
jgi:hypothetical protein